MTDPRDESVDTTVKSGANQDPPSTIAQTHPADTAQEAVHQVMLREDVPSEHSVSLAAAEGVAQPDASKVARRASPRSIAPRPSWIEEVEAACKTWPSLERAELFRTLGRAHLLSALVQRPDGLSREIADEQVRRFFETLDGPTSELPA